MKKSFNFKQHKRFGMAAASVVMVGAMAFGGAVAYLTDNEQTTNTFTVGKVQVDLEEPAYHGNGSAEVTNIVPNQEIDKNPMVENTGKNEAIVYASVSIPVKKLVVAADDGTRQAEAMTQVFQTSVGGTDFSDTSVNDKWVLIKTEYKTADGDLVTKKDGSDEIPDSAVEVVRTYGYNTKLGVNETTDSLFDKVKLVNVIEGYVDSTTQDIEVKTMAIQASNITGKDTSDLSDAAKLLGIYNVYVAQNKDTASQDADTNGKRNLHGDNITYQTRVYTSIDNSVIEVGKTAQMTTTIDTQDADAAATPTYESENTSVAKVDANGKVTAVAAGSTTIKATYDSVTASVKITVKAAANVQANNN